jgi:hypothetical protein
MHIHLPCESIDAIDDEPRVYAPGAVEIEGHVFENVGVRLKGGFSFQSLRGKAAFKIKFNAYDREQRFLGLEGITLNNMRQDRSFVHEWLAYLVFREHGLPAPRSGYVRLFVNDELYGLYANVESVDDEFLARNYADPSGNLYEGEFGTDLREEDLWDFEKDEGAGEARDDLLALIQQANQPGDGIFFADDTLLDTERFLAFVAAEAATGHWDGYHKAHNYRIYHEPAADTWTWIPWGTDQAWERDITALSGTGLLIEKCFDEPSCLAEYTRVAAEVLDTYDSLDLAGEVERVAGLVDAAALEDPRKPYEYEKYLRHQDEARDYIAARAVSLRAQVGCVEGGVEVDRDGDGYGACFRDCDDSSDQAHPGGVEVCDGLDNNCDGFVDELATCPCDAVEIDGVELLLCSDALSWSRARNKCMALGGRLASIDDADQNRAIYRAASALRPGRWYIGLNDREQEGEYQWEGGDGEVAFQHWAPGDPDDFGDEDCGTIDPWADGAWTDVTCATALPFVCRLDGP